MRLFCLAALCAALSACSTANPVSKPSRDAVDRDFCAIPSSPVCRFFNAPVKLDETQVTLPGRSYAFFPTREPLEFVDATGKRWLAPRGTLTDGASIPPVFTGIVGAPDSREFVNAAALHDAMCGIGNTKLPGFHEATWEETHRMFYEGLRVGGTDERRAKVMYAAVYLGGPRWIPGDKTFDMRQSLAANMHLSTQGARGVSRGLDGQALGNVPTFELQALMRRAKAWIERENPSIGEIEAFLSEGESAMIAGQVDGGEAPHHDPVPDPVVKDPGPVTIPVGVDPATGAPLSPGAPAAPPGAT